MSIYPWGKISDPIYQNYDELPTLEDLRTKSLKDLSDNPNNSNNKFGLIEDYCASLFGHIDILRLISIKNLRHDKLIFYCLDDIKTGRYEEANKIDLAIILYKKRREFLNSLFGIKDGNEIVPNLLHEIKENLDKESDESKKLFEKSLDFLINYYTRILGLRNYIGAY